MFVSTPDCPAEAELHRLLEGTLPEGELATVSAHVEACPHCQVALDRLTAFASTAWLPHPERLRRATRTLLAVPGYELGEELGRGGYGVVYRAIDTHLDRPVAIKVLRHAGLSNATERERFLTEARAAARLSHPNIVPVYEVGEAGGLPFIVMEYVPGGPLSKHLDGTPLPPRAAAELSEALGRAVHFAHERGVIHRDLKPGNVLLSAPAGGNAHPPPLLGTPKVSDFGTARLTDAQGDLTPTQAVLGTPSYMAPEQAFGHSRAVGPSADVYSLGAILYELLTGHPPFKASTPYETLLLVRGEEPVTVRRLQPQVPRDLETVTLKCLEKDPARRYPSAIALAEDLRRFLDGRPILARPVGLMGRLLRWARRHPAVATLSIALALLVLGSLVTVTVLWRRSVERGELAERRGQEARDNVAMATDALDQCVQLVTSRRGKSTPLTSQEERVFERVLALFDKLTSDGDADPAVRKRAADASEQIAAIYWSLGDYRRSDALRARAIWTLEGLSAEFPEQPSYKYEIAKHLSSLQDPNTLGSENGREGYFRRAAALLAEARQNDPKRWEWARQHAHVLYMLGICLALRGEYPEAATCLDEAQAVCRGLLDERPNDHGARLIESEIRCFRGTLALRSHGDRETAYQAQLGGIEFLKWHLDKHPEILEGLDSHGGRFLIAADLAWALGRRDESVRVLREGLTTLEPLVRQRPLLSALRYFSFRGAWRLGDALWQTDRPDAERWYARARSEAEELLRVAPNAAHYQLEVATFFVRCPVAQYRETARAGTSPLVERLKSDPLWHAQFLIATGQPAEARRVITEWRAAAGSGGAPAGRNVVDLIEVIAAWKEGDGEGARRLYEKAKAFTGHAPEMAVEHDVLRQEVQELLAQ